MPETLELLKKLISAPGLSGYEGPVSQLVAEAWEAITDELQTSRVGSLQGLQCGTGTDPRPKILLATHMDAIGLMVSGYAGDCLRVTSVGGVDHRVLPGQSVTVHGREDLPGLVAQPPANLIPGGDKKKPVAMQYLLVDVGLNAEELRQKVRVGDLISFAQEPLEMGENTVAGHSLDNRVSVVALTLALEDLRDRSHAWDVWAVATAQEEETMAGAKTSAYDLRPELAVAVDVTFGEGPGAPKHKAYPLGEGVTLGWGPTVHPVLHAEFKKIAQELEIPFALEPLPRRSGTDADALQLSTVGIPTMVVSIPLRYMHTPVEMVSLKDIKRAGRLLAEFVARLPLDYMDTLTWKESVSLS
ncbi:MAG: putative aminopeptidase YsdC [Chloroflexi bacterium]|nr:putative aminopeptidase YsdC [Chloroflexota bacterium]